MQLDDVNKIMTQTNNIGILAFKELMIYCFRKTIGQISSSGNTIHLDWDNGLIYSSKSLVIRRIKEISIFGLLINKKPKILFFLQSFFFFEH